MKEKLVALLFILVLLVSCNKDEDPAPSQQTISFDGEEVLNNLPDGLTESDDPYAQQTMAYVETAVNWSAFNEAFDPPDNASGGDGSYSWTWNYGGMYSLTLWWDYDEDSQKRYWDIDISYMDGDKEDYITSWENKDGSAGEVMYNFTWACVTDDSPDDCDDLYWKYSWSVDDEGSYTFIYEVESDDDDYDNTLKYVTVVNSDGSGTVDYYFYGELSYHTEWDASGAGEWTQYLGGQETSGFWPAG